MSEQTPGVRSTEVMLPPTVAGARRALDEFMDWLAEWDVELIRAEVTYRLKAGMYK